MKRRALLGAAGATALLAGCDFSLRDGVFNACLAGLPAELHEHPLVIGAWKTLDAAKMWDTHCHVFGDGDSGSGLWYNPKLDEFWRPLGYAQRALYINASCTDHSPGRTDRSFADRLLAQCDEMAPGFHVLLFAFDWARDDAGRPMQGKSSFFVPNAYAAALAHAHPSRLQWAASIHPYDPAALDRLDAVVAQGARAIKWLPSAMNIDPADARCDRFYAKLAHLDLPLISHAGDERAVHGFGEHLSNPLRLRRPLDGGVRVVAAHCASLGEARIDEHRMSGQTNFEVFAGMMDDPAYRGRLFGDLSAVTQVNRMDVLATILDRPDWHDRLLNGSDYPLPGIVPLVSPRALAGRGLLAESAVEPLLALRDHNVLLFDFVLKRSVAHDGKRFSASVFETASFFARSTSRPSE
ncbi:MAG TPA: hypothetical protein PKC97_09920 [Burkholderiaceae bacterium]|nr:hypothetical protein [Burkholderiaceae bacterium]